jgi:hypothetical protein
MKTFARCALVVLLASGAFAQRRAVGNTTGTNAGYGNVVFPGGKPAINTPFTLTGPNFANSIGNVVAGRPAFNGTVHRNPNSGAVVYIPYAYPVYSGGYYGGGYNGYGGYYAGYGDAPPPQQQQQPNVTIIYPPQQPMPMMYGQPQQPDAVPNAMIREYGPSQAPTAADAAQPDATYYLLAFKDHSIYSAVGYWLDGDTLHYITTGNVHNQVSLSLVDRDLTVQLNKGRGVQVNLPAQPSR